MWHSAIQIALSPLRVHVSDHYLIAQCDHATLAAAMREAGLVADALVVDAPYSERTHALTAQIAAAPQRDGATRREMGYAAWSERDVSGFVVSWGPLVVGWVCSITDHVLAPAWESAYQLAQRCAFSPLACIESGSRVRLTGDGPSQWATWLVVSRPRGAPWTTWGTMPGAYVGPAERKHVVGGKPLWLMRAIVGDYSREGDLVVDPCMGAGTTLVAAVELGRRAIGCEPDAGRFELAARRLAKARPQMRMRLDVEAVEGEQLGLGGER